MQSLGVNGTVNLSHHNLTQQENIEGRGSIGVEWRWPPWNLRGLFERVLSG
jgi:hypothetical protein